MTPAAQVGIPERALRRELAGFADRPHRLNRIDPESAAAGTR
jgi:hypothetical protein